ncbi:signal peptidase I [Salinifilum ghardaiensis]
MPRWHTGNAAEDGADYRGWLLGHFIEPADDVRNTKDVEVKWGVHPAGQTRDQWAPDYARTTLVILIHGRFRIDLADDSALLTSEGDYLVWGPGAEHRWEAEEDSTVITVRWPSPPAQ